MRTDDPEQPCLHCVLSETIHAYTRAIVAASGSEPTLNEIIGAVADLVGDLLTGPGLPDAFRGLARADFDQHVSERIAMNSGTKAEVAN